MLIIMERSCLLQEFYKVDPCCQNIKKKVAILVVVALHWNILNSFKVEKFVVSTENFFFLKKNFDFPDKLKTNSVIF